MPGVYVLSELAQGGIGNVLLHPITSFLDLAPFVPAWAGARLVVDSERVTTMATKLGLTPDELMETRSQNGAWRSSCPVTSPSSSPTTTRASASPCRGSLAWGTTKNVLVAPKMDKATGRITFAPLSVSGMFNQWAQQFSGSMRSQALLGGGVRRAHDGPRRRPLHDPAFRGALDQDPHRPREDRHLHGLGRRHHASRPGPDASRHHGEQRIDPDVLSAYGTTRTWRP